jgi:hypothetical protein
MPRITDFRPRRGTAAQWASANPVLNSGELGLETDTNKMKWGDGTTTWNALPYFTSPGDWNTLVNKPGNATSSVDGFMPSADKAKLDNSASGLTPSVLVLRDSNSNFSAGTPTAAAHVATKGYVDDGAIRGSSSKQYKTVACVVRNTGSGFQFINDSGHVPVGCTSISTAGDNLSFTINYSFTATKVVSMVGTPDETLGKKGYSMGASVGLSSATFQVGQGGGFGDYISYNGSAWTSLNGFVTSTSMNGTTGLVTCTHQDMSYPIAGMVSSRSLTYRASTEGMGGTTTAFYLVNNSGVTLKTPNSTDCKVWLTRSGARQAKMDELDLANSNIWIYGIFEV